MVRWDIGTNVAEYEVRLGHIRVVVQGLSHDDAIRQARLQICHDMPRLWDIVQGLNANRFEVTTRVVH